jgi:8-amino-7-oxononanoate synthase
MPAWMDDDLDARRRDGLYRRRRALTSGQGAEVRWKLFDFVNFSSNDYLAYAADTRLAAAAARAALRWGSGAGASPLISGHLPPLRALERDLAAWQGTEAALVFSSGFACNLAVVSALAGREDAVFSDAHNHASLIDGCRLSRAAVHVYRHNDLGHLEELLRQHPARRRFIVSDTLFSMDGDFADVVALYDLAIRHDAMLLLDDAHAVGVLGETGRGLTDRLPPEAVGGDRVVKLGTLSKALGSQGGFVCGTRTLIDYLVQFARPYVFSTALAPPAASAARRAVSLVLAEPERRGHLLALAATLRERLKGIGLDVGPACAHVVPVIVGDAGRAVSLSRTLERSRLLVPAVRPPSVPEGGSRLRVGLTAAHTDEDVSRLVEALRAAKESAVSGGDAPGPGC